MKPAVALLVAEGKLDVVAAEVIARDLGINVVGQKIDTGGKSKFLANINRYNEAARTLGIVFALCDHDSTGCVGPELQRLLPNRSENMVLRLCVPELEAWLLADHVGIAKLLSVDANALPDAPDREAKPKRSLIAIARKSRSRVAQRLCPPPNHSGIVGPEYALIMEGFIRTQWDPQRAAKKSPSLRRALRALEKATTRRS